MNPQNLRLIGYWKSHWAEAWPDPSRFVDEHWNQDEKARVVAHLNSGFRMPYAIAGVSWCRFHCGIESNGSAEFYDGTYLWPEGFVHYLEVHNVRPPQIFIDHCLSTKPRQLVFEWGNFEIDATWWQSQEGDNPNGPKTYDAPFKYDDEYLRINAQSIVFTISRNQADSKTFISFLKSIANILSSTPVLLFRDITILDKNEFHVGRKSWDKLCSMEGADQFISVKKYKL